MLASQKTTRFLTASIICVILTGLALGCACLYCNQRPDRLCLPLLPQFLATCHLAAELFALCMVGLYYKQSRILKKQEENWTKDLDLKQDNSFL